MKRYTSSIFIFIVVVSLFISACKKESFITSPDATLTLSADTIKFDTVFSSVGSITQSLKITNQNNQKLLLSNIKLMGGNNSSYKININGIPANETSDVEIAANDSIYIFISVTINPGLNNLPFIVSDSIRINYNGNSKFIQLQAYGQNAHFLNNQIISGNTIWENDLPYVILGSLRVDSNATLNINAGCKIYSHANAPFLVDGSLKINGTKNNEVQFAGDRLDEYYKDLPASWPGIYFRSSSKDNFLKYAIIKNATQAVVVTDPSINGAPKLTLQQCIIDNAYQTGLLALNSNVIADNSLISNCGSNINIQLGGNYTFTNCTVAAYSNLLLLHNNPVLQITNFNFQNGNLITENLNALFQNCIFWGEGGATSDEVSINKEGNNTFNVTLENCLYKAAVDPSNTTLLSVIKNQDPQFDSIDVYNRYYDFRTTKEPIAPGIDNGIITSFQYDLDANQRTIGISTDIGCYEKQ